MALSPRVKRPGREPDQSPSSSAEVKNKWSYKSTPPTLLHGVGTDLFFAFTDHSMKACRESKGMAPLIINLGAKC
jgi:hypothetical protein